MRFGYKLCSEERSARDLVGDAVGAERAGFAFAALSDHFHPWLDAQGESPFAWTVLGAIAQATDELVVGTAVSCPTMRYHPAIVAQASATVATMMPERSFLGLGTGEKLNEHVIGRPWPEPDRRRDMLAEAIEVIRALWTGDEVTFHGAHVTVERARCYSLPSSPPPLLVAASGEASAALAGRASDGLVTTAPDRDVVEAYAHAAGDAVGPVLGELTACWGLPEEEGLRMLQERWPLAGLEGDATTELEGPRDFAEAARDVEPDDLRGTVVLGRDPAAFVEGVRPFHEAGFTHVCIHQVGTAQDAFREAAASEILPALREAYGDGGDGRVTDGLRRPVGAAPPPR